MSCSQWQLLPFLCSVQAASSQRWGVHVERSRSDQLIWMWMIQINLAKLVMWSKNISHTWHKLSLFHTLHSHIDTVLYTECSMTLAIQSCGCGPQLAVSRCFIWHLFKIALFYWWVFTWTWKVYWCCQRDGFLVILYLQPWGTWWRNKTFTC